VHAGIDEDGSGKMSKGEIERREEGVCCPGEVIQEINTLGENGRCSMISVPGGGTDGIDDIKVEECTGSTTRGACLSKNIMKKRCKIERFCWSYNPSMHARVEIGERLGRGCGYSIPCCLSVMSKV
jgi:hypothetical protein